MHPRGSAHRSHEAKANGEGRRAGHPVLMVFSILLPAAGGLTLRVAGENETLVRRFSNPAIQSASGLVGAPRGQAVILRGWIDPRSPASDWGLATYDH